MKTKRILSPAARPFSLSVLLILLSVIAFLGSALFVVLTTVQERSQLRQELFIEKQLLADLLARTLLPPIANGSFFLSRDAGDILIQEIRRSRDVVFLHVVSIDAGKVIMANAQDDIGITTPYAVQFEVLRGPEIVDGEYRGEKIKVFLRPAARGNAVAIGFSLDRIEQQVRNVALRNILFGVLVLVFIWGILLLLFQRFIKPMRSLESVLVQLRKGDLRAWIDSNQMFGRELRDLAETLNTAIFALRNTKEREKVVSRAKSEFISLVAHQLRTPLSATKWAIRMVLDGDAGKISKEQYELLNKGYISNERMVRLISDLLDVVRIEEGRFGYEMGEYSLEQTIREVWNDFKVVAGQKNVQFVFEEPKEPLPSLEFDPARIRIVLENLFKNAITYTETGGEVRISLESTDGEIQVAVADNGIGIPKKQFSRVFTKFFRASNAVTMETEGTGLGLYIAKNVVETHGGRIWFESLEGRGATFYFTLPVSGDEDSGKHKK